MDLLPRFRGCLLGLAVGDAFGAPLDGLTPVAIAERYGKVSELQSGGRHGMQVGEGTDETGQMLLSAQSLVDCGGFDPVDLSDSLLRYYMAEPRFIGHLTREACENLLYGYYFERAGRQAWEDMPRDWRFDNGSLARCIPIGLLRYHDHVHLVGESRVACGITHYDERCKLACVCLNLALSQLLLADAHGVVEEVCEWIQPRNTVLGYAMAAVQDIGVTDLRVTSNVVDTLQAALWVAVHCDSFKEGIMLLGRLGGDAAAVCSVAGALLGARFGAKSIPVDWLGAVEARQDAESYAARLHDLSQLDAE